jgi:hypothetical protein
MSERCEVCQGDGWVAEPECCGNPSEHGACCGSPVPIQVLCENCGGTGRLPSPEFEP